jgi:tetratricopeptide (TPR) repeat protein
VVEALKVKLLGEEKTAVLRRYTDNAEVYELYLKGRYYFFNKYSPDEWLKGLEFFDQAIEKDPEYALAYAGKARALITCNTQGFIATQEAVPAAKAAASRALELDKDLLEAHTAQASIYFFYEWDWVAAEREFRHAIELNHNSPDAHMLYGLFLVSRGRFDQAISEIKRALELDPLSFSVNVNAGWIYWFARRLDEVKVIAEKMIRLEPGFFAAYWLRGAVYWAKGKFEESIKEYEKSFSLSVHQQVLGSLGSIYGFTGKRDEALGVLDQLFEMKKRQNVNAINFVRVYVGLGDMDKAREWLERAIEERNAGLVLLEQEIEIGSMKGILETGDKAAHILELLRHEGLVA